MNKTWDEDGPESRRFRIKAAGGLLAFYAALHLAVGALIQAFTPADAIAAIAPVGSIARACKLGYLIDSDCLFD